MTVPTLVVSNPPHAEVDLDAAAVLLELDAFATRLKAVFAAPEIMEASDPQGAHRLAAALRAAGFDVAVLPGAALTEMAWPDPVETLALDASHLEATVRHEGISLPYDAEVLGVYCRPPADRSLASLTDLRRALTTGHGPTIAEAIGRRSIIDLYFRDRGSLRRVTVVPDLLELDGERVVKDLVRRLPGLRLDRRLEGIRPRAPFAVGRPGSEGPERRRYSFGTLRLYEALGSIAPELASASQFELGSRLAYVLSPLRASGEPAARIDASTTGP